MALLEKWRRNMRRIILQVLLRSFLFFFALLVAGNSALAADAVQFRHFLRRHYKDKVVDVPLTELVWVDGGYLDPNYGGWVGANALVPAKGRAVLLLEMGASNVPPGPWGDHSRGAVQIVLSTDVPRKNTELYFDGMSRKQLSVIDHFFTHEPRQSRVKGTLQIVDTSPSEVMLSGRLRIVRKGHSRFQSVSFNSSAISRISLKEYVAKQEQAEAKRKERNKKIREVDRKISEKAHVFYENLFNQKKYPGNTLRGEWESLRSSGWFVASRKFSYVLSTSYIASAAKLTRQPSDLEQVIGGNIFRVEQGSRYVIKLHHLEDPYPGIIDDEENYAALIDLENLLPGKEYKFGWFSKNEAILGYYHWGPAGHIRAAHKVRGFVRIDTIESGVARGELSLAFKFKDSSRFRLSGRIELPIVTQKAIDDFERDLADLRRRLLTR